MSCSKNTIHCDRCCHDVTGLCVDDACPSCGLSHVVRTALPSSVMYRPWLHRFACTLVFLTFILVSSGGNVTSRDAGLAVPDGFWVFDHFLWTFPFEKWTGGIFHEHLHRLIGSGIGILCIVSLFLIYKTQPHRMRLKKLGWLVLAAVIFQGVLGALRVDIVKYYPETEIWYRVAHAISGQLFLCLTVLLAIVTSRYWLSRSGVCKRFANQTDGISKKVRSYQRGALILFYVLFIQLVLGAVTRHSRANETGLSIPDYPYSYGQIIPPMTAEGIAAAQDDLFWDAVERGDREISDEDNVIFTPFQVIVHFSHRVWAIVVFFVCLHITTKLILLMMREQQLFDLLLAPTVGLLFALCLQVTLGMLIIWTNRMPDVATSHQALGAIMLASSFLLWVRVGLCQDTIYHYNKKTCAASGTEATRAMPKGASV